MQATETTLQADGTLSKVQINYKYDALGRLIEEKSQDLTGDQPAADYTIDYTYDLAGNRLSMVTTTPSGTVTVTYVYNGNDELLTQMSSDGTVTSYTYDANGSVLQEQVNGQTVEQYTYNLQNQMLTATAYSTSGGQTQVTTTTYYYDNDGNKVRTVTSVSVNGGAAATTATDYVVDEQNPSGYAQVLEQRDGTTHAVQMTYILGDDIIAQVPSTTSGALFFLYDGHGSVRLLTNLQGAITNRFAYTAFGNPIGFTPATAATQFLYSGQQWDPVAGLYYMRARVYDPATGRFTQSDPLPGLTTDALSLHRYAYVQGNPVNADDPSGQAINWQTFQPYLGIGALGALGAALFFPGFLLTNFYLNAVASIYSGLVIISDIIGVAETMPYLSALEHQIGHVIKPGSAAAKAVERGEGARPLGHRHRLRHPGPHVRPRRGRRLDPGRRRHHPGGRHRADGVQCGGGCAARQRCEARAQHQLRHRRRQEPAGGETQLHRPVQPERPFQRPGDLW